MTTRFKIYTFLRPFLSVILGLFLGLLTTYLAGESPWHVLQILGKSAFGSRYDFAMTLFYATPLIFTGLSVAFAFHAGLFNIGAEGQLMLGSLTAATVGILFPNVSPGFAPFLAGFAAFFAGGLWAAIPGWLKAVRGSHEVINTIMFNFIASGICSYVTLYMIPNPRTQNPETASISPNYFISHFDAFPHTSLSVAIFVALGAAFFVWFFLWKTVLGFEIRAVGQNENAARAGGIHAGWSRVLAMGVSGGLAGLVGVAEVLGNSEKFKLSFSPGYGFMGIAVALLGKNRPLGVILSAFLFGALHKGTSDLDLETENVTRDLSLVLQACVILVVSADGLWNSIGKRFKDKGLPVQAASKRGT